MRIHAYDDEEEATLLHLSRLIAHTRVPCYRSCSSFWRENCAQLDGDKCQLAPDYLTPLLHLITCSVDGPLRVPMHKLLERGEKFQNWTLRH